MSASHCYHWRIITIFTATHTDTHRDIYRHIQRDRHIHRTAILFSWL